MEHLCMLKSQVMSNALRPLLYGIKAEIILVPATLHETYLALLALLQERNNFGARNLTWNSYLALSQERNNFSARNLSLNPYLKNFKKCLVWNIYFPSY